MQLRANVWVTAYLRQVAARGGIATVLHAGDADFGAILIKVRDGNGNAVIYEPVSAFELSDRDDRKWRPRTPAGELEEAADALLERMRRTDRDLWVLEIQTRDLDPLLGDWLWQERPAWPF